MSDEYALLRGGEIEKVVTTTRPYSELRARNPEYEVIPLERVPLAVKRRYRFWGERP